ncbi:nicotinamide N-methyltransferase [Xenopus laevis]|uniref:Nicotinamide N-methyltransferase n=2 Tax=Xenopus laevis TaxID=8355 RepID=A0A1L8FLT8_XENLA|nr:nicotinamide N-methyltransferase [Xenopus laevis]OCT72554.1 hypothetical protein XELAEV_18035534mg [Xenopus laevis]
MESDSETNSTSDNNFDARKYQEVYYGADPKTQQADVESKFVLEFLHDIFASGHVAGGSLIEIGAGPVLYHIVSASERFNTIYLTDYYEESLHKIDKCLQGKKDAFEWTPYLKYICNLEGNTSTPKEKMEKMKRNIKLMKYDVTLANPLQPNTVPQADCVIVVGCLICACKTPDDFQNALNNISSLVKPEGYLIIVDYLGASYYLIGQTRLNVLSLDENAVRQHVTDAGFSIEEFKVGNKFGIHREVFDCKEVFCLLAKK